MSRVSRAFWIWGSFLPEENKFLKNLKRKVNSKLSSPEFDIHMTLSGPYKKISKDFLKDIESYCSNNYSFQILLDGFKYKNYEFESFYISVLKTSEIKTLRENLFNMHSFPIKKEYWPHISLAYGRHDLRKKKELILKLPIPFSVTLSKLSIVSVDENINKWK